MIYFVHLISGNVKADGGDLVSSDDLNRFQVSLSTLVREIFDLAKHLVLVGLRDAKPNPEIGPPAVVRLLEVLDFDFVHVLRKLFEELLNLLDFFLLLLKHFNTLLHFLAKFFKTCNLLFQLFMFRFHILSCLWCD